MFGASSNSGGCEKSSDFRYAEIELTRFVSALEVGSERKRTFRDNSRIMAW